MRLGECGKQGVLDGQVGHTVVTSDATSPVHKCRRPVGVCDVCVVDRTRSKQTFQLAAELSHDGRVGDWIGTRSGSPRQHPSTKQIWRVPWKCSVWRC